MSAWAPPPAHADAGTPRGGSPLAVPALPRATVAPTAPARTRGAGRGMWRAIRLLPRAAGTRLSPWEQRPCASPSRPRWHPPAGTNGLRSHRPTHWPDGADTRPGGRCLVQRVFGARGNGVLVRGAIPGLRNLRFEPGSAEGIALRRERGVAIAICSLTWEFGVASATAHLGVSRFVGTVLERDGHIRHFLPGINRPGRPASGSLGLSEDVVAAVGDSFGDIPLLRSVQRAYFVGRDVPGPLGSHVVHMPDGSILDVARHMLGSRAGPAPCP